MENNQMEKKNPWQYYIGVLKKCGVFKGRARRAEYWWFTLFDAIFSTFLITIVTSFVVSLLALETIEEEETVEIILNLIWILIMFIPYLSVTTRRMHDCNRSGWCQIIPIYGFILLFVKGTSGPNKYGDDPIEGAISNQNIPGNFSQSNDNNYYVNNYYMYHNNADSGKGQIGNTQGNSNNFPKTDGNNYNGINQYDIYAQKGNDHKNVLLLENKVTSEYIKYLAGYFGIDIPITEEKLNGSFHKLMAQYHPDKVAHLGDDFKKMAEEKTREIMENYKTLKNWIKNQ